jgi:membrane protein required for colicin V production
MNLLDLLILVIFVFCIAMGIFRGLIDELISIITLFLSFYAASNYCSSLVIILSRWFAETVYLKIFGWFIIFLFVFIIFGFIGVKTKYLLKVEFHRWADRILGAGVGMSQGILVVSILLFVLTAFIPKNTPMITKSRLAIHVIPITEKMTLMVPKRIRHDFKQKIGTYKNIWENDRQLL